MYRSSHNSSTVVNVWRKSRGEDERGRFERSDDVLLSAPGRTPGGVGRGVLAQAFAALADPVRLRLLSLVAAAGEVCSCDLERPLGKSQPTISHHTKALADAGLIVGEKRGRWMWWRVAPNASPSLRAVLA